jgi:hypothetical protein
VKHEALSSRRQFVKATAATAFGFQFVPRHVLGGPGFTPPSEKVTIGCIGVGGQGGGDIRDLEASGLAHIVALCDVDLDSAAGTIKTYPKAKLDRDFRELIEKQKDIDAVLVDTPDHVHAPASIMAMRAGRHVYVEKPLAHTIAEARAMREVAAETKRVTQMGNQGHAGEGIRLTREWIQAGVIGKVTEVHVWSDRPGTFWDTQGRPYPAGTPDIPKNLDWDPWLGPAPTRAYHLISAPANGVAGGISAAVPSVTWPCTMPNRLAMHSTSARPIGSMRGMAPTTTNPSPPAASSPINSRRRENAGR